MELGLPPTAFHPHPLAIEFEASGQGSGVTTMEPGRPPMAFYHPPLTTLCCQARFGIPAHSTGNSSVSSMELNPSRRPSVTIGKHAADYEFVQPCHLI